MQHKSFATPCTTRASDTQQHKPVEAVARPAAHKADNHGELLPTPRRDNALTPSSTPCCSSLHLIARVVNDFVASAPPPLPRPHPRHWLALSCRPSLQPHLSSCLCLAGHLGAHAASMPPSFPRCDRTGSLAPCRVALSLAIIELLRAPLCQSPAGRLLPRLPRHLSSHLPRPPKARSAAARRSPCLSRFHPT
jgi:hypothetical protein